ncbi:hypothetical protein ACU8KH_01647 [Lachancea thermotolerans]
MSDIRLETALKFCAQTQEATWKPLEKEQISLIEVSSYLPELKLECKKAIMNYQRNVVSVFELRKVSFSRRLQFLLLIQTERLEKFPFNFNSFTLLGMGCKIEGLETCELPEFSWKVPSAATMSRQKHAWTLKFLIYKKASWHPVNK